MIEENNAEMAADPTIEPTDKADSAPAPAETESEQLQASETPDLAPTPQEDDSRRDTKAERRIGKLVRRNKENESTIKALEEEKAELQKKLESMTAPNEADYDYDSSQHTAALVTHAATRANLEGRLDSAQRELARIQQAQQQRVIEDVKEKVEAFKAKTPDYAQSVAPLANLPNVGESVVLLDNTPEVYYALSKDMQLAYALEQMSPQERLIELGRISADVSVKPNKVSAAPPPVQSAQGGTAMPDSGPRSDMSMDEFSAWYDKQYTGR